MSTPGQDNDVRLPPYNGSTFSATNISEVAAMQETTIMPAGPSCLRFTPDLDNLLAKIKEHIVDREAVDAEREATYVELVAFNLAVALLDFYQDKAQPPHQNPYRPILDDLYDIIFDVLAPAKPDPSSKEMLTPGEGSRRNGLKRMKILRLVDDFYGSKGWAIPLPVPQPSDDSGFAETSEDLESSRFHGNGDAPEASLNKRPSDGTLLIDSTPKRLRKEGFEDQLASQPQVASNDLSLDHEQALSLQSQSQGGSHIPNRTPSLSRWKSSPTRDSCEKITGPRIRIDLQEQVIAEIDHLDPDSEANGNEVNENQGILGPPQCSRAQLHSKPGRLTCPFKKIGAKDENICGWSFDGWDAFKNHVQTHYPDKLYFCQICFQLSIRKDTITGSHLKSAHRDIYDKEELKYQFKQGVDAIDITDTFCDICPHCETDLPLETNKDFYDHLLQHAQKEIATQKYRHRCSRNANHDWKNSSCIPERYRKTTEPKNKINQCRPHGFDGADFRDDGDDGDDSDDNDTPSNPPPPGSKSSHGYSGQQGSGTEGQESQSIDYSFTSNNDGHPYQNASGMSRAAFFTTRTPQRSDSNFVGLFQRTNRGTATHRGDRIRRRFKSIRHLGRGGFGIVDEVICKSTYESYARKIIPLSLTSAKISAEVKILKQLRHQHIISLDSYSITSDHLSLFTTPVAKGNLATYLRADNGRGFTFPDYELLRGWEGDLASALRYLHGQGITHGDLKPENVLVSFDMKVYVADFGCARAKYDDSSFGVQAPLAYALTPKYSAPEVSYLPSVDYSWDTGAAADIFSFGAVCAEIETIYTGLSIHKFETFRSACSTSNSFQANLPKTHLWVDFLWVLQESVLQTPVRSIHGPSILQFIKEMLSFDPQQRPSAQELTRIPGSFDFDQAFRPESIWAPAVWMVESLDDYLRTTSPPFSAEDKLNLWSSATGIFMWTDLLNESSDYDIPVSQTGLRPKNILVYRSRAESPYVGRWKINDPGNDYRKNSKDSEADDKTLYGSQNSDGRRSYGDSVVENSSLEMTGYDMWSLGSVLAYVGAWTTHGWEGIKCNCDYPDRENKSDDSLCTMSDTKLDYCEICPRERGWNAEPDLPGIFADKAHALTKSFAESVIAPMLESSDKQPSWKWLRHRVQTILGDARGSLHSYKKTLAKSDAPLLSRARSKLEDTYFSSVLASDGSRSDQTDIFLLSFESEWFLNVGDDDGHTDPEIEPDISTGGLSYSLERYVRDKRDCRYLFPAQGYNAVKQLHEIYLDVAIEGLQRLVVSTRES